MFNWRWILLNEVPHRAVTIERVNPFKPLDTSPVIYPAMLESKTQAFFEAG